MSLLLLFGGGAAEWHIIYATFTPRQPSITFTPRQPSMTFTVIG